MSDYIEMEGVRMSVGQKQTTFSGTGSVRDDRSNKIRYDLVSPYFIRLIAIWCSLGAMKYAPRNWEKGQALHIYVGSLIRHIYKFLLGESDENHLVAAAWNIMAYLHTEHEILEGRLPEQLLTAGLNQRYTEEEYNEWEKNKSNV